MHWLTQLRVISEKDKTVSVARLVKASTGDFDFYLFAILGVAMASLGLILGSPEVVIGSMLIAPILYPLLSFSLGLVLLDVLLALRSLRTLAVSTVASVAIAFAVTTLLNPTTLDLSPEILTRAEPSVLYFFVAFISGLGASYALVQANVNEMFPGIAISVSLVPPLAVVGISIAALEPAIAVGALALFALNVAGIIVASMLAFSIIDLHPARKIADSAIHQEERRLIKEHEKAQEFELEKGSQ